MKHIKLDLFITPETFGMPIYRRISEISPRLRAEYIRSLSTFAIKLESWFKLFEPKKGLQKPMIEDASNDHKSSAEHPNDCDDIRVTIIIDRQGSPELFKHLEEIPNKRGALRLLVHTGFSMNEIIALVERANRNSSEEPYNPGAMSCKESPNRVKPRLDQEPEKEKPEEQLKEHNEQEAVAQIPSIKHEKEVNKGEHIERSEDVATGNKSDTIAQEESFGHKSSLDTASASDQRKEPPSQPSTKVPSRKFANIKGL